MRPWRRVQGRAGQGTDTGRQGRSIRRGKYAVSVPMEELTEVRRKALGERRQPRGTTKNSYTSRGYARKNITRITRTTEFVRADSGVVGTHSSKDPENRGTTPQMRIREVPERIRRRRRGVYGISKDLSASCFGIVMTSVERTRAADSRDPR